MSIPTPIRKNGIKIALPTKSILFIRGEWRGISVFSARPAINAPIIPSIPAHWDKIAPRKTMTSTKIYWDTLSRYLLKNHLAIRGNTSSIIRVDAVNDSRSLIQNKLLREPLLIPTIIASTSSASMLVISVLPTDILTALFFASPSLLTIGYVIRV